MGYHLGWFNIPLLGSIITNLRYYIPYRLRIHIFHWSHTSKTPPQVYQQYTLYLWWCHCTGVYPWYIPCSFSAIKANITGKADWCCTLSIWFTSSILLAFMRTAHRCRELVRDSAAHHSADFQWCTNESSDFFHVCTLLVEHWFIPTHELNLHCFLKSDKTAYYSDYMEDCSLPYWGHNTNTTTAHMCSRTLHIYSACKVWLHMGSKFIIPSPVDVYRKYTHCSLSGSPSGLVSIVPLYTSQVWNYYYYIKHNNYVEQVWVWLDPLSLYGVLPLAMLPIVCEGGS